MDAKAEFTVQNSDGHSQKMTDEAILDDMRTAGLNPLGFSSDGLNIKFADNKGEFEVPVDSALSDKGWAMTGFKPQNADYSAVSPRLRASLSQLPDDLMKEAYLKGTYKDATIKGSGDDWYMFNPETNQWVGLTNSPGLDLSDAAAAGLEGLRMVGSIGGALAGSAAAPGAGTIVGAGIGGALGSGAIKAGLAAFDPAFKEVLSNAPTEELLLDAAKTGGLDALAAALPFGIAKALPKSMAGAALEKFLSGPLSSTAQTVGKTLGAAGGVADTVGNVLGKKGVAEMAANFIPGVGDAINAGYVPRALERGSTFLAEKAAKNGILPELAQLRSTGRPIGDKVTEALLGKGEIYGPRRLSASDVFGNIGEKFADSLGGNAQRGGQIGEGAGRLLSNVADLFRAGEGVATRGVQAGGRTLQGVGKVSKGLGAGLDTLGASGRAIEYPAVSRMASEELLEPRLNSRKTYRQRMQEFQARGLGDTI